MTKYFCVLLLIASLIAPCTAEAGAASKLFQETAEILVRRGGKEVAAETAESLARKMTSLAARHGDDLVVTAFKRVGPQAARLASEAGEHSGIALRLLGRYGDDGIRLASRPEALKLAAKYGDDVAAPILRHGDLAERLIERYGAEGASGLARLSERNARRLAILVKEHGEKVTPELMGVFARHGNADAVAEWVWRNKGSLFVGTALTTFVANPDSYLNATEAIATRTLDSAVKPLAEMPKALATEAAAHTNWTAVVLVVLAGAGGAGWYWTERIRMAMRGSWPKAGK